MLCLVLVLIGWLQVGCVGGRIDFVVASIFLVSVSFL